MPTTLLLASPDSKPDDISEICLMRGQTEFLKHSYSFKAKFAQEGIFFVLQLFA